MKNAFLFLIILVWTSSWLRAEDSDLISVLSKLDEAELHPRGNLGFAVAFKATFPEAFMPSEIGTGHYEIVWADHVYALKSQNDFTVPARPLGEGDRRFYDSAGNFSEKFISAQYALNTSEVNRALVYSSEITINTNGTVTRSNEYVVEEIHPVGYARTIAAFDRFRWATGRGFGKFLEKVTELGKTNAGTRTRSAKAVGVFIGGVHGTWQLLVDEAASCLVREAAFTPDGSAASVLAVANSGLVECRGTKIADSGTFRYYGGETHFAVQALKAIDSVTNDAVFTEVVKRFKEPLARGNSEVIDYFKEQPERMLVR